MTRRQQLQDAALILAAAAAVELQLGGRWPSQVVAIAVAAWMAALLLRRRVSLSPLAGPVAVAAAARLDPSWSPRFAFFFALLLGAWLVGWAAARAKRHKIATDVAWLIAVVWLALVVVAGRPFLDATYLAVFGVGALLLGRFAGRAAERVAAGRLRLESVERERATYVRMVANRERARIAIELHDLVGHSVGVMTLQAGAARLRLEAGDSEATRQALLAVETVGHAALVDLRRLLGVLRRDMTAESG